MSKDTNLDKPKDGDIFSLFGPEVKPTIGAGETPRVSRSRARVRSVSDRTTASPTPLSTAGKRRRRSNSNVDTDVTTLTTDSSTDGAKVKNRREKQFIVDLLKNAEEKKQAVKT